MQASKSAETGEPSSMSSNYSSDFMKVLCPSDNMKMGILPHPSPPKHTHGAPYYCVGCKEKDLRTCYHQRRDETNFDNHLHKECYESSSCANSSIKLTFLKSKKCEFVFQKEAAGGENRLCDSCGKDVKGWSYRCKICERPHYLHPPCARLPIKLDGEKGIVLRLDAKTSSKCLTCGRRDISDGVRGWSYVSNCGNHCYHVRCVEDWIVENLINKDHLQPGNENENLEKVYGCNQLKESYGRDRRRSDAAITRSRSGKGVSKYLTEGTKIVIGLIISAMLGIPITSVCNAFYNWF